MLDAGRLLDRLRCALRRAVPCRRDGIGAQADAVADFYKGKTLSLIAGFPPGGGYDTYVRMLARHYGRFIPGQPLGRGLEHAGRRLAHRRQPHLRQGRAGRLSLAMFASSAAMEPLLGNKAALFDATKFSWIGSMSNDVAYCGVWQAPGSAGDLRRDADQGDDLRRRRARRRSPFSIRWCSRTCCAPISGSSRLSRHARHQPRDAARRGERHLRHVRLLDQVAVRRRREGRAAEARDPDGQQEVRRVRRGAERVRLRQDRRWTAPCSTCTSGSFCSAVPGPARPAFRPTVSRRCARRSPRP